MTVETIKAREREQHLEESDRKPAGETIKNSEHKANNILMSTVKPMRLSFKHIIEPGSGDSNTTAASGSPFKKRLNDLFTGGSKFAFEEIIHSPFI